MRSETQVQNNASTKVRIAFVIDAIFAPTAGTENQLLRLIRKLDRDLFIPYLVVLRSSQFLEKDWDGCETYNLNIKRIASPRATCAFAEFVLWLKKNKIDIVHTFFKDSSIIGILAATTARVPVILSARRNSGYADTNFDLRIKSILDRFVHFYIANGIRVKEYVSRAERINVHKIRVFYNLIDDDIKDSGVLPTRLRERLGLDQTHVVFLMVANLRPVKGHSFLIESLRSIRNRIQNAKFLLVGGGPDYEQPADTEVFRHVAQAGLQDLFVFQGLQRDVRPYLAMADVGVLCSSSEGFSASLLEYAAAGLPCIATRVGSNEEIVIQEFNGFLVPYGDQESLNNAVLSLYSDAALRKKMGENSKTHFSKYFEPKTQMEKLQQFYIESAHAKRCRTA